MPPSARSFRGVLACLAAPPEGRLGTFACLIEDVLVREELVTDRLDLSLFAEGDVIELHAIFADPTTNTTGSGPFSCLTQTRAWVQRRRDAYGEHGLVWYAVRLRDTGGLLGDCGMFPGRTGPLEPELGYLIRLGARGNGYATEAAAAVITECRDAGLDRIWATIRPANLTSRHIVERLGMRIDHAESDDKGALLFYVADAS